jgi:hypothetical protein
MSENAQTSQSRTAILTPDASILVVGWLRNVPRLPFGGSIMSFAENLLLSSLPPPDFQALRSYLKPIALEQGTILHDTGAPISGGLFPFRRSDFTRGGARESVEAAMIGRDEAVGGRSFRWQTLA